jgi:hypothetical protein
MTAATVTETTEARSEWTAPVLMYAAYAAACILLLPRTAIGMVDIWAASSNYTHGFVVAPIAIWMMFDKRNGEFSPSSSLRSLAGVRDLTHNGAGHVEDFRNVILCDFHETLLDVKPCGQAAQHVRRVQGRAQQGFVSRSRAGAVVMFVLLQAALAFKNSLLDFHPYR